MKTIKLTTTKEKHNGKEIDIKTTDLIKSCANNVPQGGLTVIEMSKRLRLIDLVESVNGSEELQIEDADFDNLKSYINSMKWNIVSKAVIEFSNQFK